MTNQEPSYAPSVPPGQSSGSSIWLMVAVGLTCLSLGLGVSFLLRGKSPNVAVAAPNPSSVSSAQQPKPEPSLLERAAMGETKAMEELGAIAIDQRDVKQAVALSKGRAVQKSMALDLLRENLQKSADADGLKRLMQFAQDGETARTAIGVAAELDGPKGSDLLYELSIAKNTPGEMALLAGQLLNSKELRSKASPALALVLDLRDATSCEQRKGILEKAVDIGDKRIVRHIVPLTKKSGCGDKKNDDCNPCLREGNQKLIRDSMGKTQGRKAPSF